MNSMTRMCYKTKQIFGVSLICVLANSAFADDTEIFKVKKPTVASNVLFVFDNSGSMKREVDSENVAVPPVPSRLQSLRTALGTLLSDPELPDVNLGMMNFSGHSGSDSALAHGPSYPVAHKDANARTVLGSTVPLASDTSKDYLQTIAAGWSPENYTPLVDALYEAALYFKGRNVDYGDYLPGNPRAAHASTYTGTIGVDARYITPIKEACQSNHIILLSDGKPTVNNSSAKVKGLISASSCAINDSDADGTDDFGGDGRCGPELAHYLANTDHLTTGPNKEGKHRINVHTIGFAVDPDSSTAKYLKSIADTGKGINATANSTAKLVEELKGILDEVDNGESSFTSPTYSIDPASILSHGNAVYLPVFAPTGSSVWSGNLKKFTLNQDGELMDSSIPTPVAASDSTGSLDPGARDAWTKATDTVANAVLDGGAAHRLDPDMRNLFVDYGMATKSLDDSYPGIKSELGNAGMSDAHRDELLNFIRGKNPDGTPRYHMGDIIHSKPVHRDYAGGKGYVFVGTNEGYLHIFDDQTGNEMAAFMPSELLKNIEPQYDSVVNGIASDHLYGVDGEITLWHDDDDGNNIVDGSEKAILFFGLRRGGRSYYALDVTTPDKPQLLWKINSGTSVEFSKLAHSWSRPVVARLKHGYPGASIKDVLIIGGGYSEDASGNEITGTGNAVYIIDANTGAFVWSTEVAYAGKIKHALPAKIRVLDVDRNGSVDRLYFADTGGYIWRVDLNASDLDGSGQSGNINKARLTKFADLGSTATASPRKFFVEPDVAVFKHRGQLVLSVAIGSGDRPNPLDTKGDDQFFVLFDQDVMKLPASDANIKKSELYDVTNTGVPSSVDMISSSRSYKGWHMDFPVSSGIKGEKVLSTALTFQGKVMFTSFATGNTNVTPDECKQDTIHVSSLYVLDLLNGGAVLDLDNDSSVNHSTDRSVLVAYGEIADTPQVIFKKLTAKDGSACTENDCVHPFEIRVGKAVLGFADNKTKTNQSAINKLPKVYWIDKDQ